jgi:hypothetical protein
VTTSSGNQVLDEFVAELQAMGFSAFSVADLTLYLNRGYFHVARKNRWYWEQTTSAFVLTPGQFALALWPGGAGLPQFRSLDKVYVTDAGRQVKLVEMSDDEFFTTWLSLDLTQAQWRGNPSQYKVWNGQLYILSPPDKTTNFLVHYHRRVIPLSNSVKYPTANYTDVPITPPHLDEAIVSAAKVRCHKRANELTLATNERADLEEAFDDMRDDEAELVDEGVERVSPDDTWL